MSFCCATSCAFCCPFCLAMSFVRSLSSSAVIALPPCSTSRSTAAIDELAWPGLLEVLELAPPCTVVLRVVLD
ncbi:hypothetical protein C8Q72DRAFT_820556 [Fomitopsis betulina]|nr:hypothetical protein C8Q72DRAFT_820556 [Fomitopsis betulina]